jgi:hypothetical protein
MTKVEIHDTSPMFHNYQIFFGYKEVRNFLAMK